MSKQISNSTGGISFIGALTLIFIVLKLCNQIDWSWWLVLSPIWITFFIVLFLSFLVAIYNSKY